MSIVRVETDSFGPLEVPSENIMERKPLDL